MREMDRQGISSMDHCLIYFNCKYRLRMLVCFLAAFCYSDGLVYAAFIHYTDPER